MAKVSFIKLSKTVATKLDLAKAIAGLYVCFNNIKLSDTELTMLSYFMVYGITPQCKDLIVRAEICKNLANTKPLMSNLKKIGLIYKDDLNSKMYVSKNLNFELTPTIGLFLKVDNK